MSAEAVTLGPDARIAFGGTLFGVTQGTYSIGADVVDPTDTEFFNAEGAKADEVGMPQITLNVTANRQSDVSPHIAPLSLTPTRGQKIRCQLYPDGLAFPFYDFRFVVEKCDGTFNVQGSAIQTLAVSGKSHGGFVLYGQ